MFLIKEKRKKLKNLFIIFRRIIIVIIFLCLSFLIIKNSPDYDLEYKYQKDDIRVILNDNEITSNNYWLPERAKLVNDEIMLSLDTIKTIYDKYAYVDTNTSSVITRTEDNSKKAEFLLNQYLYYIDGEEYTINSAPTIINYNYDEDYRYSNLEDTKDTKEMIYLPISKLGDIYNIEVNYNGKLILTDKEREVFRFYVPEKTKIYLKYIKDLNSKTIEVLKSGDYFDLFESESGDSIKKVRSKSGEIGYVSQTDLLKCNKIQLYSNKEKKEYQRYDFAWDSFENGTYSMGSKAERTKEKNLDIIAPTLAHLNGENGTITYSENLLKEYNEWANKVGYDVWIVLKNDRVKPAELSDFLTDKYKREKAVDELIEVSKRYNSIKGINVDIEEMYKENSKDFVEFIRELTYKAHKENLVVTVCTNIPDGSELWSLCYDHKGLSENSDAIVLMAYDNKSTGSITPNAPYDWVEANVQKLVVREKVKSKKIILGIPLYSRLWSVENGELKSYNLFMSGAIKYNQGNNANNVVWDDEAKQYLYISADGAKKIWIEDAKSINEKLNLINEYALAGSAYWQLGQQTDDLFGSLNLFAYNSNIKY